MRGLFAKRRCRRGPQRIIQGLAISMEATTVPALVLAMTYERKFEALAAPPRRAVFDRLRAGPLSVSELAADLPVSRPAVSQHLKVLKDAGLVVERREGVKRIYRLDTDGIAELRDYFDRFWDGALDAYKRSLEMKDA